MRTSAENTRRVHHGAIVALALMTIITAVSSRMKADTGTCSGQSTTLPFTDVSGGNIFFCSIAEAFFSGLTNGTTSTTYSPGDPVPREQMAAFVSRTLDQSLKRGSRRAALRQFWTPQGANNLALTTVGTDPLLVESDGADLWVANFTSATVSRVNASDGRVVETWTGATKATGVLVAMGKVFITGQTSAGSLYQVDPTQSAGAVTTLSTALGSLSVGIAFDGQRIWIANNGNPGSVSVVTLNPTTVTNVTTGFFSPFGILYDGANIWVTDLGDDKIKKLDSNGAILQSVTVGTTPDHPAFDGTNIWVPNINSNTVSVVRTTGGLAGTVIATLTGNGLNLPFQVAFDGERILVTNSGGSSVSLWKASDLTPIGNFLTGASTNPGGVCSDGLNFWITLSVSGTSDKLARF